MSRDRRSNQLAAVAMLLALLAGTYLAFRPSLPLGSPYEVDAVVRSANQLRGGAPVRIAGVDVGEVARIGRGPGDTATVTLRLEERARPVHADATIHIRPRGFLEGGFYVELSPGTPAAPELASGGTLGLSQTAGPVQFDQLLSVFRQPLRESLRDGLGATATGLSGGGSDGLLAAWPELAPALRDTAIVARAARGTRSRDVSRLVAGAARVAEALAADRRALGGLVTSLRVTTEAATAADRALGRSVAQADALLREAPGALDALDAALPVLARVARAARPAVAVAPAALARTGAALDELARLVAPRERARTVRALRTTFVDLPRLVVRLGVLFPTVAEISRCLSSQIVPVLQARISDGELSTGQPVWQEFAHSLVGLASADQNFDADGFAVRYLFGGGSEGFSTDALPGIGVLRGSAPEPLRSRPVRPADGEPPPIRRDVPCSSQPLPDLTAEEGPG